MAADKGSAIYISSTESSRLFNVEECRFNGCMQGWSTTVDRDTTFGGAIYIEANSFIIKITKCFFKSNKCGNGAAICYIYESSTSLYDESEISGDYEMLIFDCIFVNNEAHNRGGAIYVSIKNGELSKQIEITKCIFYSNAAKQLINGREATKDNPEEGGVIAFIYEAPTILETKSENTNNFILNVFECLFYQNSGRNKGGCFYIDVTDREPTNPIGISSCSFNNNYGGDDNFNEGDAGDIYYVF